MSELKKEPFRLFNKTTTHPLVIIHSILIHSQMYSDLDDSLIGLPKFNKNKQVTKQVLC